MSNEHTVAELLSSAEQLSDGPLQQELLKQIIRSVSQEFCQQIVDLGYGLEVPKSILINMLSEELDLCVACVTVRQPMADSTVCRNCGCAAV